MSTDAEQFIEVWERVFKTKFVSLAECADSLTSRVEEIRRKAIGDVEIDEFIHCQGCFKQVHPLSADVVEDEHGQLFCNELCLAEWNYGEDEQDDESEDDEE